MIRNKIKQIKRTKKIKNRIRKTKRLKIRTRNKERKIKKEIKKEIRTKMVQMIRMRMRRAKGVNKERNKINSFKL